MENEQDDQPNKMRFLFLSNQERKADGSRLYRCVYQGQILAKFGHSVSVAYYKDATDEALENADVVVFSRCLFNPIALRLVRTARRMGKVICGDLDDKVYAPWAATETGYMRSKIMFGDPGQDLTKLQTAKRDLLRFLPLLDEIVVSSAALSEELTDLGFTTYISRNAIDDTLWPGQRHERTGLQRLLFMTGTKTHDADFKPIVGVLKDFLVAHPEVHFTILGPIDPPAQLTCLPNTEVVEKVPLEELYPMIARFDLCVTPLENTSFNDCKSALKFIECGLVSVPVIASPRREFVHAIRHGENGLLAEEPDEWRSALEMLLNDPELLGRLARSAHESVLMDHAVSGRGPELATYYNGLLARSRAS